MTAWSNVDLTNSIENAGGVDSFLNQAFPTVESLSRARELYDACCTASSVAKLASRGIAGGSEAFVAAAEDPVKSAREKLRAIEARAAAALSEMEERKEVLETISVMSREFEEAKKEENAVRKCKNVADSYLAALRPLLRQQRSGRRDNEALRQVAGNVGKLIEEMEGMRKIGAISLFADNTSINKKLLISVENRGVDAVIKARAAFVNVLDNEFRALGWPMEPPSLERDGGVLQEINFNVLQLNELQRVAKTSEFIREKTQWHRDISDSWAMAAILRAPLARFKYHFLEHYRAGASLNTESHDSSTARFDRPEWAADFALARIAESTPFLKEIVITDTATADVKFAEGFCKVFAEKVAADCDLAMRGSKDDDVGADTLISHAATTAAQFDNKIQVGLLQSNSFLEKETLPCSLHILSMNDSFFATWASSELRLAEPVIHSLVRSLFSSKSANNDSSVVSDLETDCIDIVEHVSRSSRGCRQLQALDRRRKFVQLTEVPLLQVVRAALKAECGGFELELDLDESVFKCARAVWVAGVIASALRDKAEEPFYVDLNEGSESADDQQIYSREIEKFEKLAHKACQAITSSLERRFLDAASDRYASLIRFGELPAVDAAVILAYDLSADLCPAVSELESRLKAVAAAIPNRKVAASIWRPLAIALDTFFFEQMILQAFTGGKRSVVSAASVSNDYMKPRAAAKMARQLGHDASVLVNVFRVFTTRPENFLRRCAESAKVLQLAAMKVIRPKVDLEAKEQEVVDSVSKIATVYPDDDEFDEIHKKAKDLLRSHIQVTVLEPREALELMIIAGLADPPLG